MQFSYTINELDHAFYSINMVNNFPGSVCAPFICPLGAVIDQQLFLKHNPSADSAFFTHFFDTQIFTAFIEQQSFAHTENTALAFFDECAEKVHARTCTCVSSHTCTYIHAHACHFGIDENFRWTKNFALPSALSKCSMEKIHPCSRGRHRLSK